MAGKEYSKVIEHVTFLIRSGQLSEGSKLPTERALAEELGLGRNSTREALRTLENMGVIESRHGSGNFVTGNIAAVLPNMLEMMMILNKFDMEELHTFRKNMEKAVCGMLLEKKEGRDELCQRALELLDKIPEADEEEKMIDMEFHFMLVEGTGNRLLISLMQSVSVIYKNMIDAALNAADKETREALYKAHRNMAEGIREGNAEKCYNAIDRHYEMIERNAYDLYNGGYTS